MPKSPPLACPLPTAYCLLSKYSNRGGEVLDGGADRFEEGDLVGRAAPGDGAARQIEEIAQHGVLADHAGLQRLQDVAGLAEGAGARVDEDAGAARRLVVGLAHAGPVGADTVDMRAGREPGAADQRLGGERGGGDN